MDLSLIQYREGLTSYQRVVDAQRYLTQQQDNLASTTGSVAVNLVAMYKALGGGWELRQGKDFVPLETRKEMRKRTDWGDLLLPEELEEPSAAESLKKCGWPEW